MTRMRAVVWLRLAECMIWPLYALAGLVVLYMFADLTAENVLAVILVTGFIALMGILSGEWIVKTLR
jgi:hypothetical protein